MSTTTAPLLPLEPLPRGDGSSAEPESEGGADAPSIALRVGGGDMRVDRAAASAAPVRSTSARLLDDEEICANALRPSLSAPPPPLPRPLPLQRGDDCAASFHTTSSSSSCARFGAARARRHRREEGGGGASAALDDDEVLPRCRRLRPRVDELVRSVNLAILNFSNYQSFCRLHFI